ncbi:TVP38/TMEM64 family protein [Rhodovulum sp. DZ06]|uniref:TVP38/TMEM64 family protein n=1 Tax=Rhodovulum sp. DZ06 TaxID=3425126 RepID=UPI003D33F22B
MSQTDPLRGAAAPASPSAAAPETPPAPPLLSAAGLRRIAPLAVIALGAVAGAVLLGDHLSFDALRDNRAALTEWRDANLALAAATYSIAYILVVAFSLPGALAMTLTGGFLFGLWLGAGLILVSATIGATLIFLAARTGLGDRLAARLDASGGSAARIRKGLAQNEVSVLLLMRLVPVVPFFIANLAPAFFGVRLRTYLWTTFFGIMPGTVVYTSVGAGLGEVFARGEDPDLGLLFEPHVLGPLLGLCALAALPAVLRMVRGRAALPEAGPARAADE